MEKYIKAILVKPDKPPRFTVIVNELHVYQALVKGNIEVLRFPFDDRLAIICNEEGLIRHLPVNLHIGECVIYGTAVIVGVDGEDFCSLTDEQFDKYGDVDAIGYRVII